jgi:hypothetical protein
VSPHRGWHWHLAEGGRPRPAQHVITANVRDFPAAALKPLGLEAVHPDDFLLDQLDLSPPTLLQVIREQSAHTRRPPLAPRDLATLLSRAGVPDFADEILRLMAAPLDGT